MLLSIIFRRTLYKTGSFKISNFQSKLRQSVLNTILVKSEQNT